MTQVHPLVKVVQEKQNNLWLTKASHLDESKELYFAKALRHITTNTELMKVANSQNGILSILKAIDQALQAGLQIGGGIAPQLYLIPFNDSVAFCPTAEGYKHICLSDPPVINNFLIRPVYEGDKIQIKAKGGITDFQINIESKKRVLIGFACEIEELDGRILGDYISRGEIEEIRDKWSKQPNGKAWTNSFEQMAEAKAGKRFLKPYAARKEALRMALEFEGEQQPLQEPDNRPIDERTNDIIDAAIIPEPEPGPKPEKEKEKEKEKPEKGNKKQWY